MQQLEEIKVPSFDFNFIGCISSKKKKKKKKKKKTSLVAGHRPLYVCH